MFASWSSHYEKAFVLSRRCTLIFRESVSWSGRLWRNPMRSCLPPLTPYGVKHRQPGICHALFTLQPKCVVIWFILDFDFIFRYLWNNHRVWNKGKPNLNHRLNRTIKYKLYLLMLAFRLLLRWKVLYVGCVLLCRNRYHGEIVSGVVLKFKRPRHSWWVFQTQIADNRISEFVICEPFTVLFSILYGYYFKVSI